MFATPAPKYPDEVMAKILAIMSQGQRARQIEPGMIELGHFNASHEWQVSEWHEHDGHSLFTWENENRIPDTCVVDSPAQWKAKFYDQLAADSEIWCAFFTHIEKTPGQTGGWRWHKWGPYVGEGEPTREYLDDEPGFDDGVWVVHVHRVLVPFTEPVGPTIDA